MEIDKFTKGNIIKITNKKIKCPHCNKSANKSYVPFCSKKCSDIDLLKWLSNESYINLDG